MITALDEGILTPRSRPGKGKSRENRANDADRSAPRTVRPLSSHSLHLFGIVLESLIPSAFPTPTLLVCLENWGDWEVTPGNRARYDDERGASQGFDSTIAPSTGSHRFEWIDEKRAFGSPFGSPIHARLLSPHPSALIPPMNFAA